MPINNRTKAIIGRLLQDSAMGTNYALKYTKTGLNGTVTNSDGSQLVTGGAGSWADRVVFNDGYVFPKNASYSFDVVPTVDGTGIAIGFNTAIVSGALDLVAYLDMNATKGKLFLGQLSGTTFTSAVDSGADRLLYTNGVDTLRFTLYPNFKENVIYFSIKNLTTSQKITVSRTNTYTSISKLSYYVLGGTQRINNLKCDNNAPKTKVAFIGDSIMFNPADNGYPDILARQSFESFTNYGVSGTSSANGVTYINSILSVDSDIYFLGFGANDVKQSISTATYIANMTTIKTAIEALGKQVIFLYIPPFDVGCPAGQNADIDAKNAALITAFGAPNVLTDTYTSVSLSGTSSGSVMNPTYYNGDGSFVHMNATGATAVTTALKNTTKTYIKY